MDRTVARAHAMKLVYEWEMGGEGGEETKINLLEIVPEEAEIDFMNALFAGVIENLQSVDAKISAHLRGWTIDRLSKVDLAILRIGVYELSAGLNAPAVVVNEAVELAKQYSSEKAGSFINGVLGSISREE